jgi:TP901-1 family phage major tail protein
MAKQAGTNVLLQVGQTDGSPETFTTLDGQQDGNITIDLTTADITDKSNSGWTGTLSVLSGATVTVSGVTDPVNNTQLDTMRTRATGRTSANYRMLVDNAGSWYEGSFNITAFSEQGNHTGAIEYNITLQNDGTVVFNKES